jgi:hypothetical protein
VVEPVEEDEQMKLQQLFMVVVVEEEVKILGEQAVPVAVDVAAAMVLLEFLVQQIQAVAVAAHGAQLAY